LTGTDIQPECSGRVNRQVVINPCDMARKFEEKPAHGRCDRRSAVSAAFHTPRNTISDHAFKRLVGIVVAILSASLVFIPIPLSNVVPALVIALISLAYLEEDGLLLLIGLLAAAIVLTTEFAVIWEMVRGAKWIIGL
jgi:hypothetical protein